MMKSFKNLIIGLVLASVVFIILAGLVIYLQYNNYVKAVDVTMAGIINEVKEKYPNVSEEKLIELLNSNSNDFESLASYGIDREAVIQLKSQLQGNILMMALLVLVMIAVLGLMFWFFIKARRKQIKNIEEYIEAISNLNYSLDIVDNDEGELSKLKNNLYKLVLMLKETSLKAVNEKAIFQESVANISHQLKTPLTSILILLDNLKNEEMDEKTRNDFIKEIVSQVTLMNFLVVSMLKLAKLDAGAIDMKKEAINSLELVQDAVKNLDVLMDIKNIQVEFKGSGDVFMGDYRWQLEALTNIIKNSVEYSAPNGKIKIELSSTKFGVKILIIDEGKGISKKELKHIFDRFYNGENASDSSIGIGLSLAKSIIEKDNGYIRVESTLGKGTTFEINYMK